jgi:hypothetical protein
MFVQPYFTHDAVRMFLDKRLQLRNPMRWFYLCCFFRYRMSCSSSELRVQNGNQREPVSVPRMHSKCWNYFFGVFFGQLQLFREKKTKRSESEEEGTRRIAGISVKDGETKVLRQRRSIRAWCWSLQLLCKLCMIQFSTGFSNLLEGGNENL